MSLAETTGLESQQTHKGLEGPNPSPSATGFVYKWTNLINCKWYIGSHEGNENDGYIGSGKAFCAAVKKHGIENFTREIIYRGVDVRKHESKLLLELDAMHDPMSYNLINDGIGSSGRNNPAFGRTGAKHPMFGKHLTQEAKAKSIENRGPYLIGKDHPMFGRSGTHSPTYGIRGEKNQNSKLTQIQADEIRQRLIQFPDVKLTDLAVEYDVSRFTIARVRDNKTY